MDKGTLTRKKTLQRLRAFVRQSKLHSAIQGQESPMVEKFKGLLHVFKARPREDSPKSISSDLDKMSNLLREKEKRIADLLQYEYGAKRAIELNTWQQEALESEKQLVKNLEKENESQKIALFESLQQSQQFQSSVELLQKRIDELLIEKRAAVEKVEKLEQASTHLTNENVALKVQFQQVDQKLLLEVHEKQELEVEINALYKQFNGLKLSLEAQRQASAMQKEEAQRMQKLLEDSQEQNGKLKVSFSGCHDEMADIKQFLTKGLRDAKELENRYAEAIAERMETLKALQQQRRECDKLHHELFEVKERLGECLAREKNEQSLFDEKISFLNDRLHALERELKQRYHEREEFLEQLDLAAIKNDLHVNQNSRLEEVNNCLVVEKEFQSTELQRLQGELNLSKIEIDRLGEVNEHLQQELTAQVALSEEKQQNLDEAQQHLAKKVRETALLNEKLEEFILREVEAGNVHDALQQANSLLQGDLQEREKKIKELTEKVDALEKEILKWEGKWRETNQSRQVLEEKIQELEKIELRHAQLQNLLLGFGAGASSLAEHGIVPEQPVRRHSPLQFGSPIEELEDVKDAVSKENLKPYPNLFDVPQMKMSSKQNLFD